MRVTLVGSGRYAREIVASNYHAIDPGLLCAVVTPRDTAETLEKTALAGLPILRSPQAWRERFGCPTKHDVFDLCVHPSRLLEVLQDLVEQGASRFVLPKPVAVTRPDLDRLAAILDASQGIAAVASQWHYSGVTALLAAATRPLAELTRVNANFSQTFTKEQLGRYTPATALLPHILEILISTGLWGDEPCPAVLRSAKSPSRWELTLRTAAGVQLELVTDLNAPGMTREVRIERGGGQAGVAADFVARFEGGRLISAPSVTAAGQRQEIFENNIQQMLQRTLAGFRGSDEFLTFDRYRLQAEALLSLCEA